MFQDLIRETPFTTEAANAFFTNIKGESWNGDCTFISTIRALLGNRFNQEDSISLKFRRSTYDRAPITEYAAKDRVRLVVNDADQYVNTFFVINVCHSSQEVNDAWIDDMRENLPKVLTDFSYLEKVAVFFRKICSTACFVNAKTKTTILFVSQMTARRMHYIQSGIPAYLPWYFDPAQGLTEDERNLLYSFREKSSGLYIQICSKIAEAFDFETARIRRLLGGFENRYERIRLEQAKREVENIRRSIAELNQRISNQLRNMRDEEILICGLDEKIKSGECNNDVMDYFIANKHLVLRSVDDTTMEFVVKAQLDFFDEEQARKYINRDGSYFYDYIRTGSIFTRENIKMLMTEIFLTQRLKVNFCAAYNFQLEGNVTALRGYASYGGECAEYTPNPHIDRYRCLGTYETLINERLTEHDYIGALEQCIASCKSLNLADSAVMGAFVERFCRCDDAGVNMRCVVLPTGLVVTPDEAITWLLKEKKEKEEAKRAATEAAEAAEPAPEVIAEAE